jgi:hypothetical protein
MQDRLLKRLSKKAKKGLRGYPVATIAFYGPDNRKATKVAVGIILAEHQEAAHLRRWYSDDGDIRGDAAVMREVVAYLQEHDAQSVAMTDGIIGCPHEEGIDYEGEHCPMCLFWIGRDRWADARLSAP